MSVKSWIAMFLMVSTVAGCASVGQSRLNPFNWFRSNDAETLDPIAVENERRPLVPVITNLVIERTPGGAIVRATALPPTQGWFAPELISATPDGAPVEGVLSFAFRAVPPETATRQSTAQSRELSAAVFVATPVLNRIRVIQVTGSENSRIARR